MQTWPKEDAIQLTGYTPLYSSPLWFYSGPYTDNNNNNEGSSIKLNCQHFVTGMHHHRPKGTRKGSESGFNGHGHRWWWTNGSVQCCWVGGCASGEFGKCINFEWLQLSSGGGGLDGPEDMQSSPRKRGSFDKLQFGHQLGLYYFDYCSL